MWAVYLSSCRWSNPHIWHGACRRQWRTNQPIWQRTLDIYQISNRWIHEAFYSELDKCNTFQEMSLHSLRLSRYSTRTSRISGANSGLFWLAYTFVSRIQRIVLKYYFFLIIRAFGSGFIWINRIHIWTYARDIYNSIFHCSRIEIVWSHCQRRR